MDGVTFDTASADKDQLISFAKTQFNITIDPRGKLENIRTRVQGLIEGIITPQVAEDDLASSTDTTNSARFVRSTVNGHVYAYQQHLVGSDFEPCDADGNPL